MEKREPAGVASVMLTGQGKDGLAVRGKREPQDCGGGGVAAAWHRAFVPQSLRLARPPCRRSGLLWWLICRRSTRPVPSGQSDDGRIAPGKWNAARITSVIMPRNDNSVDCLPEKSRAHELIPEPGSPEPARLGGLSGGRLVEKARSLGLKPDSRATEYIFPKHNLLAAPASPRLLPY